MRTAIAGLIGRILMLVVLFAAVRGEAHDVLADGSPVPAWVVSSCCGPSDFHHLQPNQVHETPAGWKVDGYPYIIPYGKELPTQDGEIYIFYKVNGSGGNISYSPVYCFFIDPRSF